MELYKYIFDKVNKFFGSKYGKDNNGVNYVNITIWDDYSYDIDVADDSGEIDQSIIEGMEINSKETLKTLIMEIEEQISPYINIKNHKTKYPPHSPHEILEKVLLKHFNFKNKTKIELKESMNKIRIYEENKLIKTINILANTHLEEITK